MITALREMEHLNSKTDPRMLILKYACYIFITNKQQSDQHLLGYWFRRIGNSEMVQLGVSDSGSLKRSGCWLESSKGLVGAGGSGSKPLTWLLVQAVWAASVSSHGAVGLPGQVRQPVWRRLVPSLPISGATNRHFCFVIFRRDKSPGQPTLQG